MSSADRTLIPLTRLVAFDAAAFALGSAAHLGLRLSVGPLQLADPPLVAPMLVDATCALGFVIALIGLTGRRRWRITAALGAHIIGITGIAFGILALIIGAAPRSGTTDILHPLLLIPLGHGLKHIARLREPNVVAEAEVELEVVPAQERRVTPPEHTPVDPVPDVVR